MAPSVTGTLETDIAISALTGAMDTAAMVAICDIAGIGIALPAAIGMLVGCGFVAFMAMALVQVGSRS